MLYEQRKTSSTVESAVSVPAGPWPKEQSVVVDRTQGCHGNKQKHQQHS